MVLMILQCNNIKTTFLRMICEYIRSLLFHLLIWQLANNNLAFGIYLVDISTKFYVFLRIHF